MCLFQQAGEINNLGLPKLSGNSVIRLWLHLTCLALEPLLILQNWYQDNLVGPVSNIVTCTSEIKDSVYERVEGEFINRIFHVTSA